MADEEIIELTGTIEDKKDVDTKTGKTFTQLTIAGKIFSLWDTTLSDNVNKGDQVKVYYKVKGSFNNISNIAKTSGTPPTPPQTTVTPAKEPAKEPAKNMQAVDDYKSADADKFELGMAKNNAAVIISAIIQKTDITWETAKPLYWQIVGELFTEGKKVRKANLKY